MPKVLHISKWLTLIILFFSGSLQAHEYYVSISDIEYNPKSKSFEITLKLFTDDLELALQQVDSTAVFSPEDSLATQDSLLADYCQRSFTVKLNGNEAPYSYIGYEFEEDVTLCYLEAEDIDSSQLADANIAIENSLLMDVLPSQVNLVHLRIGDQKRSLLLRAGQTQKSVIFP